MPKLMEILRTHFDGESCRVYLATVVGTSFGAWMATHVVWILTAIYIGIKIYKQIRDWKDKDKD
jgi:uncharacterized membrane protein